MTRYIRSTLALAAASALAVTAPTALAFEPQGKVDCIAPSDPGGGWDFTCRSVGRLLEQQDKVSGNVQTTNMAGAGGGVAFAHTVSKRRKDESLIVAASTATTTRLAQKQFPGMNADMVKWVAALGADYGIIAVRKDSPYNSLPELMDAVKKDPRAISFAGGSATGGWDHLKVLQTAEAAGVDKLKKIKYLSYNNGGEAITQILGGHITAFTGDISESVGFVESGDLKVLAVLSDKRLPEPLEDIPTAEEQGIDSVGANWRGFYMPGQVSDDAYQWWVQTLDQLYTTDAWQKVMKQNGLMPFHMSGDEFTAYVKEQIADIAKLSKDIGMTK
ncbi:Bug family tripartite tricarboxylate transporter substrate binding protein [Larsenimonas suaedae]|uniref:Tripartite tricarboxylate transporter substrate-binding protein n=1 Tax=Larsenimonas suaedae TaxID=1851019 RepID=A0ABU1GV90_9GAMM|nr:tripartite tricarboxylate transporter substrate-binding protein [Larsenimonas suaedae]MCM2971229.1 tripartite tricarboxylate transporter substrate-binding protein [Larsenimonas suaedae]MDR5895938.1 tripartite tricarboxylate transporter substrate-binding protein [Larsenimonas suaedae]